MATVGLPIKNELLARKDIIDILTNIGFKDGASMTREEMATESSPIFWEDILNVDVAKKKPYYLVFSIGTQTSTYADNIPLQSVITINLDLFTTKDISSKDVYEKRLLLEQTIAESDTFYNIQLLSKFYDNNVGLNQISYIVQKVITYEK